MAGVFVGEVMLRETSHDLRTARYGMVLSKDKNEEEAWRWLIRSVHLYPMNWGCWLEMTSLVGRVEDVRPIIRL